MASACCSLILAVVLAGCSGAVPDSGQRATAAQGADLVTTAASVSDDSPSPGGNTALSVTVRNIGTKAASSTTLRYYRSPDRTISTTDTEVGNHEISELAASADTIESWQLRAPVAPGTYFYGACVDPVTAETDASNNCSAEVRVTVRDGAAAQHGHPDLVVASPATSDGSPAAGGRFTLSASVRNSGGGSSAATTLRYYRSADAAVSASDTEVGTADVAELSASGSTTLSVQITAPATPGTYFYGACADAVAAETDDTNNCSTTVRITIEEPDLVVGLPTVSNASPVASAQFALTATVANDGTGPAAATTLRYYQSEADTISTSDSEMGSAAVAGLADSGSSSQSVDLTAPSTPGSYYYGACVDAVPDESNTENNCSAAVLVTVQQTVTESQGDPDLTLPTVWVSDNGPIAGTRFRLSATVRNDGDGGAVSTTLRYYRSSDPTITAGDTEEGIEAIVALAASGSAGKFVDLTAPSTPGPYYYGACVDAVDGETDITNNCSASVPVTVPQPPRPDLAVAQPLVSDSGPATGARFTLSATVTNGGTGDAASTTLRYYRSSDSTIKASDAQVATDEIAALAAAGSSGQSVDLTAPSTPGRYYYGACVDAVAGESYTANNCSPSVTVTILQPDLVPGSPSVNNGAPEAGASFTLSVTVQNNGEGESDATTLRYYSSASTSIETSDTEVGTDSVAGLGGGETSDQSIDLIAPDVAGAYHYGACVDTVTDEADTNNNCSSVVTVTVTQAKPDLAVGTPSVDENNPDAGATFTLSATVKNDGKGAAVATTLRYYQSDNAAIATTDTEVGTDSIGALAASGTSDQSIDLAAPDTAGTHYYGACVDALTDEVDATNNCSSSVTVTVPEADQQTGPSVEISVEDDKEYAPVGDTIDLSAEVLYENGDEVTGATVTWSSSDTTKATVDTSGVMTAVGTGWVTLTATTSLTSSSMQSLSARKSGAADMHRSSVVGAESDKNISGSVRMHVVEPVARIEISPTSVSFDSVNDSTTLTATLYDDENNEMQPTYWGWSSEDKTVATVSGLSGTGIRAFVQPVGEGTTNAKLSANGSRTGTASVTVALPKARVKVSSNSLTFEALGDSKTVTVTVVDADDVEDEDATFSYVAFFSACCGGLRPGDPVKTWDINRVEDGLEITSEGTGSGRITISSTGVASAVVLATIYQKASSLTVSPNPVSLSVDGTATLSATVKDANEHEIRLAKGDQGGRVVYWETSDSGVATVEGADDDGTHNTGATATVTGVAAGSATITGRPGGTAVTGTVTVTVTE